MALQHAHPAQAIDVAPLGDRLTSSRTTTLLQTETVELVRLVLPAGKEIPPHRAPGAITLQCLEGRVEFSALGVQCELAAGTMTYLAERDEHALRAVEDSSLLLTILLAT